MKRRMKVVLVVVLFVCVGVAFAAPQKSSIGRDDHKDMPNRNDLSKVSNEKKINVLIADLAEVYQKYSRAKNMPHTAQDEIRQIYSIRSIDFWSNRKTAYMSFAARPHLGEYAQVVLIEEISETIPFSDDKADILVCLIQNPSFEREAAEKILVDTDKLNLVDSDLLRVLQALDNHMPKSVGEWRLSERVNNVSHNQRWQSRPFVSMHKRPDIQDRYLDLSFQNQTLVKDIEGVKDLFITSKCIKAYTSFATRQYLPEYAQITLINEVSDNVSYSHQRRDIVIRLIENPQFAPGAAEKILRSPHQLNFSDDDAQKVSRALNRSRQQDLVKTLISSGDYLRAMEKRIADLELEVQRLREQINYR